MFGNHRRRARPLPSQATPLPCRSYPSDTTEPSAASIFYHPDCYFPAVPCWNPPPSLGAQRRGRGVRRRIAPLRTDCGFGSYRVTDLDVIIVGADPAGLTLAAELSLAGVRPLVLEQYPAPRDVPKASGIAGRIRRGRHHRLRRR
ncbi:hypothetical protein F5X71_19190 [Nocardia brasiliensis]|uniref:FAD-binding domain-containing protein n=1 Tax=Nocardia brasiliensis TaxID=37326 RepID=A0A6G9Y2Z8_NOCBR|nr:hypothetical protein F5X71_19190 [Nocardia brasiliensis]